MIQIADHNTMIADDPRMKANPDKKFFITMDFYDVNNNYHDANLYPIDGVEERMQLSSPQMNHISYMMPPSPPLTQYSDLSEVSASSSFNRHERRTFIFCLFV